MGSKLNGERGTGRSEAKVEGSREGVKGAGERGMEEGGGR